MPCVPNAFFDCSGSGVIWDFEECFLRVLFDFVSEK